MRLYASPRARHRECMKRLALILCLLIFAGPAEARDDRQLYENIVERVAQGEGYYSTAADELRKGGYPLKPALAFRPPTLAVIEAMLPNRFTRFAALIMIMSAAVYSWMRMLRDDTAIRRIATVTMLVCGLANVGGPGSVYLHEAWAICFIALSLGFYRNLGLSLTFAFIAVLIRETAILLPIAMGISALFRGDQRRALWLMGLGVVAATFWLVHAMAVSQVVTSADPASPGWIALGGLPQVLSASKWNLLTSQLEGIWLALVVLMMTLGLALAKRLEIRIAALFVALFAIALLFFGRPDNDYWGIMVSPFMALGIPSVGAALHEKVHAIGRRTSR
jgi:hypothetical protein